MIVLLRHGSSRSSCQPHSPVTRPKWAACSFILRCCSRLTPTTSGAGIVVSWTGGLPVLRGVCSRFRPRPLSRYHLPAQLRHSRVVVSAEEKPLALLALLQRLAGLLTIVFTGSVRCTLLAGCRKTFDAGCLLKSLGTAWHLRLLQVETTHRLFCMLDAFEGAAPMRCVEFSRLQSSAQRTRALEEFRARVATVLVASDAATRGLDIEVHA